jgi:hypothetical protein
VLLAYRSPEGREAVTGEDLLGCQQSVEAVGLALAALLAAGTLHLEHFDPLALQVFAQPGAVAAGALDPDQHLPAEVANPARELGVAGEIGGDNDLCE